jgi:hypothetical protein
VTAITNDRSILIPKKPGRQPRVKTYDSNSSFAIDDASDASMITRYGNWVHHPFG